MIVTMEVSNDVSVSQLLVDFQTQARNNLLPPYDVDLSSMSLTFTMTSNGKFRFIKKNLFVLSEYAMHVFKLSFFSVS